MTAKLGKIFSLHFFSLVLFENQTLLGNIWFLKKKNVREKAKIINKKEEFFFKS